MKKLYANNDKIKYALVDDDVFETIQKIGLKFYISNNGYFRSTAKVKFPCMNKKKQLLLHHFVWTLKTGKEPTLEIDHINRDKSNNQFSNLRLATRQQQSQHRGRQKNNTSGYIGVSYSHYVDKRKDKKYENDYWRALIRKPDGKMETKIFPYTKNGKQHAAMWYDMKSREYFGKFCGQLNFQMPSDKIE